MYCMYGISIIPMYKFWPKDGCVVFNYGEKDE